MSFFGATYFGDALFGNEVVTTVALGISESTSTLSDIVARLSDRAGTFEYDAGSGNDPREQRRLIQAARSALRDIASVYDWRYYQAGFRIATSPSVSVTASSYVASTGTLTITSAQTWPSDAIYGEVTIDGTRYPIATRVSDTVVVLTPSLKRQSNFTGSVQWTRSRYTTPLIRSIYGVWEEGPERRLQYLSPAEFRLREMSFPSGGTPVVFTIEHGNRDPYIAFSSAPSTEQSFMVAAKLAPPYPRIFRETAEIDGLIGEYTVECNDANETWVGTVVRVAPVGTGTDDAKEQAILYDGWGWQSLVVGVAGTVLTLYDPLPRSLSGELAIVSSPIDVSATMQTYYESLAYSRYCRNHKHDSIRDSTVIADADLMRAMEADAIANQTDRFTIGGDNRPLYDIHSETWQ